MSALLAALVVLAAPDARSLGLQEALQEAQQRNLDLAAERRKVDVAHAGVSAAGQLNNPTLALSYGPDDPKLFGTVDVKLPLFGQRGAALETARRDVATQEAQVVLAERRLRASVRRAYFALAAAQGELDISAQTARLSAELQQLAQKRLDTGQAPRIDVEQATVASLRAGQEQLDRAAAEIDARQQLAQLLGEPPDAVLQARDPLSPTPRAPELAALLGRVGHHAELASLEREREAQLARASQERKAILPVPDVSLEVERLTTGAGTASVGLRAGVAFDLPILSQNRGRVQQAEAGATVAEAQLRAARQRLESALRAAFARWEAASRRAELSSRDLLPAAERLLQTARDGFAIGRTPFLSVVQAQAEMAAARRSALESAADAQKAFADLEEAVGEDL